MNTQSMQRLAAAVLASLAGPALAHEGHGLVGGHWHTTDVWGFIALAAAVAIALWFSRSGKP